IDTGAGAEDLATFNRLLRAAEHSAAAGATAAGTEDFLYLAQVEVRGFLAPTGGEPPAPAWPEEPHPAMLRHLFAWACVCTGLAAVFDDWPRRCCADQALQLAQAVSMQCQRAGLAPELVPGLAGDLERLHRAAAAGGWG